MFPSTSSTALLLLLSTIPSLATAQTAATTQTVNSSQSSAISALIASYTSSLLHGPAATSIALEVYLQATEIPASQLPSIAAQVPSLLPSPTGDLYVFATAPVVPGGTAFTTPAWFSELPAGVRSDVEGLRTSVVLAEASIVRSVLGVTGTAVVAAGAATTTTTAAAQATSAKSGAGGLSLAERGFGGVVLGGVVAAAAAVAATAFLL